MQHELIGSAENSDSMLPGKYAEAPRKRNPLSSTTRWLHLVGLSALAIAQPILGRLGGNSPYLKIENFDTATLWVMLVIILAGLPALIFIATIAVGQIHRKTSDVVYHGFVFVLATLLSLSFANWLSKLLRLKSFGIPDTALLVCALFAACLFVILYRRYPSISQCLTLASISPLLVAVSFLTSPQMKPFLFSKPVFSRVATVDCANPVPVVMIVFDGLNGMALLNEEFQLDAIRYPNFARLARQSTWYRNATTVHYRTSNAVPAILTGRLPGENTVPTEESFPDNLFRQIYDSGQYDMTVFEPLTRLCPEEISPVPPRSDLVSQQLSLLRTLGLVYLDISLPDEFSNVETISPLPWFGLREKPLFGDSSVLGLAIYGWDSQRKEQF